MQHCHTGLDAVRFSRIVEAADQTELICHFFNIITEIRETLHQMKVSAETDPVDLRTQQGTSYAVPVFFRIQCGIAALHESRSTAQPHREQIGVQTQFMCRHIHARTQSGFITGEYTFDQSVKTKLLKSAIIRLHAYPAVVIEDISLFAVGMHHIDQLPAKGNNEIIDKCHPIRLFRIARHMSHMQLSLIDKIFRCHAISVLFLELL